MSKISLTPNASGTATFTLAAPGTNSDRTLTLPDATGTVFVSGQALSATTGTFSGNVTLGSSVLATPSGSAPSYTCRAWVNFDGSTGSGNTIRGSGNISSVVRSGTGNYYCNFATAMPDTIYALTGTSLASGVAATDFSGDEPGDRTTTRTGTFYVRRVEGSFGSINAVVIQVLIHR